MKKIIAVFLTATINISIYSAQPAAAPDPARETPRTENVERTNTENERRTVTVSEDMLKKWKSTLEFGISKQRIQILKSIYERNDKKTFPLILKVLENDVSDKVRLEAIKYTRLLKYKKAAPLLMKYLKEENVALKTQAILTLGILKYKPLGSKLLQFFDSDNNSLKTAAIRAAGAIKLKTALPKIHDIALNMETTDSVREKAIISMGKIGSKTSIPILIKIYDNPAYNKYMRMFTVTSLGMIGGTKAFKHIKKAFNSNEYFIRLRAVEAFGRIKNPESAKFLRAALKDDNVKIRIQALRSLEKQPNKEKFFRQLQYMIQHEASSKVKKEAVITYIKIGGSKAIDYVKKQVKKPGNHFLKYYIALGLERIQTDESVDILKNIFKENKSVDLRNSIIRILMKKNSDKSTKALKELLKLKEPENIANLRKNKIGILRALTRSKPEDVMSAFENIIKKSKDIYLRLSAIRLVAGLPNKKGHPLIKEIINDDSLKMKIRIEAIRVAGRSKITDVKDKLKQLLFKPDTGEYEKYVIKNALIRLGEDRYNLEAEIKKREKQRQQRSMQRRREEAENGNNANSQNNQSRNNGNTQNNNSNSTNNTGNDNSSGVTPSGVPRTFNPGR